MTKGQPSSRRRDFERVANQQRSHVIESYCPNCKLFVGASSNLKMLAVAELIHSCPESR
jgi:hypothetical protein